MGFRCVRCLSDWNEVESRITVHSDSDASEDIEESHIYINKLVYVKFDWYLDGLDFMRVFLVAIKTNLICDAWQYSTKSELLLTLI